MSGGDDLGHTSVTGTWEVQEFGTAVVREAIMRPLNVGITGLEEYALLNARIRYSVADTDQVNQYLTIYGQFAVAVTTIQVHVDVAKMVLCNKTRKSVRRIIIQFTIL